MPDESLLMLANEIRNKTLKMLDGLSDEEARFTPPGLSNNILWHAGHALVVNEHLGVSQATGKPPILPDGWFDLFSWKSQPTPATQWPTTRDVVDKLKDQLARLTTIINALSPEQLSRIVDPTRNRTLRFVILHGLHDEANHQGEMWLLKKLRSKGK